MNPSQSLIVCLFSALLALHAMQAPAARPITERSLLDALKIGGLTTSELIRKLKERGVDFAITSAVEQELQNAGASAEVIQAARDNYRSASVSKPGVYFRRADQWIELRSELVDWTPKFGAGAGKITGTIPGAHSPNSYRNPLKFVVITPVGLRIDDYLLVRLHEKHGGREFEIDASRTSGRDLLRFSSARKSDRMFQVDLTGTAGEYGFLMPDTGDSADRKMYTFRVLD